MAGRARGLGGSGSGHGRDIPARATTEAPGPGFLNASAALASAYGASTPVVCITGEIPSRFIGRGLGHLHELPDQLATMRSLTKWAAIVEHPGQAAELTSQAMYQARSGRPRPTAIAVPWDVGIDLEYLAAIRAALPADGFLVEEICQAGFASYFGFPVHAPRQFVSCGHQGTLGFGYPASLGVKAAFPDRAVVSIAGDGGFMFGIGELATAVQHDLGGGDRGRGGARRDRATVEVPDA